MKSILIVIVITVSSACDYVDDRADRLEDACQAYADEAVKICVGQYESLLGLVDQLIESCQPCGGAGEECCSPCGPGLHCAAAAPICVADTIP